MAGRLWTLGARQPRLKRLDRERFVTRPLGCFRLATHGPLLCSGLRSTPHEVPTLLLSSRALSWLPQFAALGHTCPLTAACTDSRMQQSNKQLDAVHSCRTPLLTEAGHGTKNHATTMQAHGLEDTQVSCTGSEQPAGPPEIAIAQPTPACSTSVPCCTTSHAAPWAAYASGLLLGCSYSSWGHGMSSGGALWK